MNRRGSQLDTLIFIIIAVVLMLIADHFVFGGKRAYIEKAKEDYYREHPEKLPVPQPVPSISVTPKPAVAQSDSPQESFLEEEFEFIPLETPLPEEDTFQVQSPREPLQAGRPRIAIIIDDVGMDVRHSREAIERLPKEITLAFLPYAPSVRELAAQAKADGHELMIHAPMEATNPHADLGGIALHEGMNGQQIRAEMEKMFESFDGYVGLNNHMGSRLTTEPNAMRAVMDALKVKGLYFIDSRTTKDSVANDIAQSSGISHASRDVFLDHENTPEFIQGALAKTEKLALRNGSAIAIGHPRAATLPELEAWVKTLSGKGIDLVPVSALLTPPGLQQASLPPPE